MTVNVLKRANKRLIFPHTVISSMLKVHVKERTSASGLFNISQHEGAERKQSVLCANGLIEVVSDKPFKMLVSNF